VLRQCLSWPYARILFLPCLHRVWFHAWVRLLMIPPRTALTRQQVLVCVFVLHFHMRWQIFPAPCILIVHQTCLDCFTASRISEVRKAFNIPGTVHLILAASDVEYRHAAEAITPPPVVIFGSEALRRELATDDEALLYVIDRDRRVVNVKATSLDNLVSDVDSTVLSYNP
jgi:hypothetical protein